jgi:hypothetical protein
MAMNRIQAKKLCTAAEYDLFRASQPDLIKELSIAQLNTKTDRARKLRDKNQDLFQRQRLATRQRTGTKLGPTKNSNARTEQKVQLFTEVLQRFEKRLDAMEAAQQREAVKTAKEKAEAKQAAAKKSVAKQKPAAATAAPKVKAAPKATAKAKPTPKPAAKAKASAKPAAQAAAKSTAKGKGKAKTTAGFISSAAASASRKQTLQNTRGKAIQGHVRAAGKRKQARRDRH